MMKSNKKLPANDAVKRRYKKYKLTHLHSKYIPTFKSQKFKNNGKINNCKLNCNSLSPYYSALSKASYSKYKMNLFPNGVLPSKTPLRKQTVSFKYA